MRRKTPSPDTDFGARTGDVDSIALNGAKPACKQIQGIGPSSEGTLVIYASSSVLVLTHLGRVPKHYMGNELGQRPPEAISRKCRL